ncbi:DUF2501 domain-containing protein [Croceibacterium sp. LX-88]|uniref:DUF2501 domain-containing protein n=1 Tax=Croceibacterium selenioxidans TaxID=2838833 RepID=A0ABS5W4V2_9SPHN|nr:DUF2501 domain-containing protein [Croceibacterium selenioxidans]MBT2134521.1 DUF2501 domain-containing protein [Croceibacterium selenioxidans]
MLLRLVLPICLAVATGSASAQTIPKLPGGASSMLGGGLPNLSSVGIPNAAGVLKYCVQNKLLSATGADNVLGGLMKTPGIESKPEYSAGAAGNILTGQGGSPFSLDSIPAELKKLACDMMLKQGASLL